MANCSSLDDVIIFYRDGRYKITRVADKVVVGNYVGSEIKLDGVDYKFVKQDDILAVVTD